MHNGGAAAAAAAIAKAIKASGAIVRVTPEDFQSLLRRTSDPLIVTGMGGFLWQQHCYLMAYKGLFFFTRSKEPIYIPAGAETVTAKHFWMPG
jgi:hypothetical protein